MFIKKLSTGLTLKTLCDSQSFFLFLGENRDEEPDMREPQANCVRKCLTVLGKFNCVLFLHVRF